MFKFTALGTANAGPRVIAHDSDVELGLPPWIPVDPGGVMARHGLGIPCDGSQVALEAAVSSLLADCPLRERLSREALAYALEHHDIGRQVELDRLWLLSSRAD